MTGTIRIGTRTSRLAIVQSQLVASLLTSAWPCITPLLVHFNTKGDRTLNRALPEIGGKGLFTAELERSLLQGEIDLAVHSLKDLPVVQNDGLTLGAVVSRADVRDCLVAKHGWTLETLPSGAVVGTSSPRRKAQVHAFRPDLVIRSVRGNVETRIHKALEQDYDAVVLAAAGLERLGLTEAATQWIPLDMILPAPGQGALGVQCRADDSGVMDLLGAIDDPETRLATYAERRFLQLLGGGCTAPVAAYASRLSNGDLDMRVFVAMGNVPATRRQGRGPDPDSVCEQLARQVLGYDGEQISAGAGASMSKSSPLHGKRIVVTRPAFQAGSLIDALEKQGAETILAPAIDVAPLDDMSELDRALECLSDYRWIVFTSANAVKIFMSQFEHSGCGAESLENRKIAAVGPATMDALDESGVRTDFVPDSFLGSALAASLEIEPGDRILLPRADIGGQDVPYRLTERGAVVDDIPIYRTVPVALDEVAAASLAQGVDVVTFASGSAARGFRAALRDRPGLTNLLSQCTIACIGPRTAEAVQGLGYDSAVVADVHTVDGLIQAIASHYRDLSG